MAQLLIDNNGEVDAQDKNGETPLYQVIAHFRQPFCVPVFATLLRNGADPAKKSPSSPFTGTRLEGVYGAGGDTVLHRLARVIMIARMGGGNLKGTADIHSPEQICTRLEALIKLVVKAKIHAAFDQKQSDAWEQEVAKLFSTQNDTGQEPYRVFPKEKKYAVVANSYNPEFTQEEVYEFRLFKLLHPERAWQYDYHYLNLVDEVKEERKFLDEFQSTHY